MRLSALPVVVAALLACGGARTAPPPPPPATAVLAAPWVQLDVEAPVAANAPIGLVAANDGSRRLFVVEQRGLVRVLKDGKLVDAPFLDVRSLLGGADGEQGLLGLAFHPKFKDNGRLFIGYTDKSGNDAYAELRAVADRSRVDPTSLRVLFSIPDFAGNHNGGHLAFGPDGKLWLGTGDGGGGGDPQRTGQSELSLLGKMLRVDVEALPMAPLFVTPERWAKGLRNPWRYSFDRQTGDLWIADVGQDKWEEVHVVERPAEQRGLNFGWSVAEGAHCFRPESGCDTTGMATPVFEYRHGDDGCSITGGFVYRGKKFPALVGSYVVGDYCSGRLWTIKREGARFLWAKAGQISARISSFGEDEEGELWVADHGGAVHRLVAFLPR
ncbi:MAG: PQQ-dependent sugar dehydrogenase [Deltaproteobacteria bacterium]|nr:PQQ-dependent sugar dehydrogenase [Deltaproteobacteria bacterium]